MNFKINFKINFEHLLHLKVLKKNLTNGKKLPYFFASVIK